MQPLVYRIAADAMVMAHFAFVMFVVFGELAILVGILRNWQWVRGFVFRALHLAAIGVVVAEVLCGVMCPLTTWEQQLRAMGGRESYTGDFIPNLLHDWLFVSAEPWVFTLVYVLFGALVIATFFIAPPRWRRQSTKHE
ncbi:MAG: DUF2784 domain-containing protein [Planctomycetaceae bacterium]